MHTAFKITILALCLGMSTANVAFARTADMNLMQFIMNSRSVSHDNPQRSLTCFDYYIPLLDSLTKEYEANFAACEATSVAAQGALDDSTQPDRAKIEESASASCDRLSKCNGNVNSVDYFECYEAAGSENTKSMYTISADAAVILDNIREALATIQTTEYRCKNASERAYVEAWGAAVEDMNLCLQGKIPVPEVTTTTEVPITTTTQVPEDSTTTEESTTTNTTPAPEDSTTTEESTTTNTTPAPEDSTTTEESSATNSTPEPEDSTTTEESSATNSTPEPEDEMPEEDLDMIRSRFAQALEQFKKTLKNKH